MQYECQFKEIGNYVLTLNSHFFFTFTKHTEWNKEAKVDEYTQELPAGFQYGFLDVFLTFLMWLDENTSQLVSFVVLNLAWNLTGKILKPYGLVSI